MHCADHDCDNCKYVESSDCFEGCDCTITNVLKDQQNQIYQLQTENEGLINECLTYRMKGTWYNGK